MTRERHVLFACAAALLLPAVSASALRVSDYYSPWNATRATRPSTRFIILHTTEGPGAGSLKKIHERGEAHYVVDRGGRVYRIIDRNRIAAHAGRSMWNGRRNIDLYSVAVEVVGYHNRDITAAQYAALRELVSQLQGIYKVPDERVLCHAMVAYGAPNRWHRKSHRGRKRCGMLFARRPVRLKLGLSRQPLRDPDVRAGRLVDADPYLSRVLYGSAQDQDRAAVRFSGTDAFVISAKRSAWDIARDRYARSDTVYILPGGKKLRGNEIKDWRKIPAGTRVELSGRTRSNEDEGIRDVADVGTDAARIAGDEYNTASTVYFLPGGMVRRGDELRDGVLRKLPEGTKVLVGYTYGGYVTAKRTAFGICGKKWNYPSTMYRLPDGTFRAGDSIREGKIPRNTMVFFRR